MVRRVRDAEGRTSKPTWTMLHGNELRIPGAICKNRDGRVIPITGELQQILDRRRKARRTAARKANLPTDFVFHSLRNTCATNLIHAGVSPEIAMKLGGWKTNSMLKRYCILDTNDVAAAIAQMETYRAAQAKQQRKVVAMK